MKIAIVGAGAMGSVYAGLLGEGGNEIWMVDTWREHMDAVRTRGLHLEGASGDRIIKVNATTDAHEPGICELVIVATKAMHVAQACKSARALVGPDTLVLSIQNGLGGPETAARALGEDKVMVGVVGGFGASMRGPGHAHHNGWEQVRLGELKGPISPRLQRVASVWEAAGFRVKCFDDIQQLVWEKLICNVCYSATCTVAGVTIGETMNDPDLWKVASGCASEAYAVARAKGIHLDFDDPVAYVRNFGSKIPNARPSMLLDHMAKRLSEVDNINGAIGPTGLDVGVAAPINETVSSFVRAAERRMGVRGPE